MKEKSEKKKVCLKLNIQKTGRQSSGKKIIASGPITSWEIAGE